MRIAAYGQGGAAFEADIELNGGEARGDLRGKQINTKIANGKCRWLFWFMCGSDGNRTRTRTQEGINSIVFLPKHITSNYFRKVRLAGTVFETV